MVLIRMAAADLYDGTPAHAAGNTQLDRSDVNIIRVVKLYGMRAAAHVYKGAAAHAARGGAAGGELHAAAGSLVDASRARGCEAAGRG